MNDNDNDNDNVNPNPNANPNANPNENENEFRALKARRGARASTNDIYRFTVYCLQFTDNLKT